MYFPVCTAFHYGFPYPQSDLCPSISRFMAFVHTSVNEMSKQYLANERRYNYTTPKSFLELVSCVVEARGGSDNRAPNINVC